MPYVIAHVHLIDDDPATLRTFTTAIDTYTDLQHQRTGWQLLHRFEQREHPAELWHLWQVDTDSQVTTGPQVLRTDPALRPLLDGASPCVASETLRVADRTGPHIP